MQKALIERAGELPTSAQTLLALGCIQRCEPFFRRSIGKYPARAAFVPAVNRGLDLAWARHEGRAVDSDESRTVAREMRTFVPENPGDPILDGDDSWITMTYGNLAEDLDLDAYPDVDAYMNATQGVASILVYQWYGWVQSRNVSHDEQSSTSAYLLELSTQARHIEWLRSQPVDAELVRLIREDSVRVGEQLLQIVDEWRNGRVS